MIQNKKIGKISGKITIYFSNKTNHRLLVLLIRPTENKFLSKVKRIQIRILTIHSLTLIESCLYVT